MKGSKDSFINIKSHESRKNYLRKDFSDEIDNEIVEIDYQLEELKTTAATHYDALIRYRINLIQATLHRIFHFRKGLDIDKYCCGVQKGGGGAASK